MQLGEVPDRVERCSGKGPLWQAGEAEVIIEIPDAAKLHIQSGTIMIAPDIKFDQPGLDSILRKTPLAVLLWLKGWFACQGAAVVGPDGAAVLLGGTVSGKSTLAAVLLQRGLKLLCDDLVVFSLDDWRNPVVHPVWPEMVLWPDAAEHLFSGKVPNWLHQRAEDIFTVPYWDVDEAHFCQKPVPLKAIYCLVPDRLEDEPVAESMGGLAGLLSGALVPYHGQMARALGKDAIVLKLYAAISARIAFQKAKLPFLNLAEQDKLADTVMAHCGWR